MKRFILFLIFIALALWGIFHACSGNGTQGYYYIGRDSSWSPDTLLGKEKNMVGFTNELMIEIAKRKGLKFQIVEVVNHELIPNLDHGEVDAIFSTLSSNIANEEYYNFSDIIYPLGPVLVVRESSNITGLSDLKNKIVAIHRGSLLSYHIYDFPDVIIVPYENILKALEDLEKEVVDGVILDFLHAHAYVQSYYSGKLKIASAPLSDRGWRLISLRNRSNTFIKEFNEGMKSMKEDGTFNNLLKKWDLFIPK